VIEGGVPLTLAFSQIAVTVMLSGVPGGAPVPAKTSAVQPVADGYVFSMKKLLVSELTFDFAPPPTGKNPLGQLAVMFTPLVAVVVLTFCVWFT
jgi:hypothetical protein